MPKLKINFIFLIFADYSLFFQRCYILYNCSHDLKFLNLSPLRYSNHNFFGKLTTDPSWNKSGSEKINNPQELEKAEDNMQSLIKEATLDTKKLFAMSEFNLSSNKKRYGLVQCSRDLNDKQCNQCLEDMLDKVPKCCGTKIGWQVVAPSCLLKYDDVMFYQLISQTSTPLPGKFYYFQ
jgi:hypothetical protein